MNSALRCSLPSAKNRGCGRFMARSAFQRPWYTRHTLPMPPRMASDRTVYVSRITSPFRMRSLEMASGTSPAIRLAASV